MYINADDCSQAQADKSGQCQAAWHQGLQEASEQHLNKPAAKIKIIRQEQIVAPSEGPYGVEGYIIQQYCPLPELGDRYTLIGSWRVNDQPAGIGIREDQALITQDLSGFYPHLFLD